MRPLILLILSYLFITKSIYVTEEFIIFIGFLFLIYSIFEALYYFILETYFKHLDITYNFLALLLLLNKWTNLLLLKNIERINYNISSFDINYFLYLIKELITNTLVRPRLLASLVRINHIFKYFMTVKYVLDRELSHIILTNLFKNLNYYYFFFLLQNLTKKQLKK